MILSLSFLGPDIDRYPENRAIARGEKPSTEANPDPMNTIRHRAYFMLKALGLTVMARSGFGHRIDPALVKT